MSRLQLVPVNVQYLATAPAYPTLQAGDMYYDTTLSSLQVYTGSAWVASGGSVALLNAANTFTVSPQTINIASSSAAGLVIKGTTSQTGNLLELRNVTGGLMFTAGNETVSYRRFSVISPSASTVPLIVTGAASQSANLQQWQDSAGTVLANIFSDGDIGINSIRSVNGSVKRILMNQTTESVRVTTATAAYIGLVIRGVSGQTADLQQWQDSAGTVLSEINAAGAANFVRAGIGGITPSTTPLFVTSPNASYIATIIRGASGQSANLQEWQSSSGTVLAQVRSSGQINTGGTITGTQMATISTDPTWNALIVRGAASQTANLQQWQNSSGTTLLRVNSDGQIQATQPTSKGLVVRAATTLTATITDAVGSGTTVTYTAANTFSAGQTVSISGVSPAAYNLSSVTIATASSTQFTVTNTATGTYVSGGTATVAQSANIQEWQYSDGGLAAYVSAGNGFYAYSSGSPLNISRAGVSEPNIAFFNGYFGTALGQFRAIGTGDGAGFRMTNSTTTNEYARFTPTGVVFGNNIGSLSALGQITSYSNSASTVGLVVRGAASQTANLTEWQDSSGTVLTNIDSTGRISSTIGLYTSAKVSIGGASWSGGAGNLNVFSTSTSNPTIVTRASASQTSDLQQWQNNSGTALSAVTSSGRIWAPSMTVAANGGVSSGSQFGVVLSSASSIGAVIRGAASQTANLTEWQDSSGNILSRINSSGSGVFNLIYAGSGATSIAGSVTARLATGATTNIGLLIQGVASQSANLTEWQSNTGVVLASINYTGALVAHAVQTGSASFAGVTWNGISNPTGVTTLPSLVVKGITSQTANLQEWQDSAGTVGFKVGSTGQIIGFNAATTAKIQIGSVDSMTYNASTGWVFTPYDSAKIAMVVKGVASQTADLQQWQNSAGSVISKVDSTGFFSMGASSSPGGVLGITASLATYRPLVIKAAASQTANLTEWQDSAGTVQAKIDSTGYGLAVKRFGVNAGLTVPSTAMSYFETSGASNQGIVVRGFASQSANLQEWQNSAGTVKANIYADGYLGLGENYSTPSTSGRSTGTKIVLYPSSGAMDYGIGVEHVFVWYSAPVNAGHKFYVNNNATPALTINSTGNIVTQLNYAAAVGLTVKGAASQTANLTEWQSSAGTILARVGSGGAIVTSGVGVFGSQSNTPNAQLFVLANSTSNPTTVVKAVASQSSNLQEWQDSAGTVLAKVDVSGAMFTVTAPVGTDTTQVATTEFVIDQIAASVTSSGQLDPLSISANTTLLTSKRYFVTSASALTLTLPASPALNDEIQILDASGNAATYNITVARNGNLINGGAGNLIIDTNGNWTSLLYTGSTYGWKVG